MDINERVNIHDKYSFEIKLGYKAKQKEKESEYNINTYLFVPYSLDINKHTYKKEDFYNDLKNYIRFKTPTFLLREIIQDDECPFSKLKKGCEELVEEQSEEARDNYEYHVKMFCSILKSTIRDHVGHIYETKLGKNNDFLVENYISNTKEILSKYRELQPIIDVPIVKDEDFGIYLFGDEYISHLVEKYTHRLLDVLKNKSERTYQKFKEPLLDLLNEEIEYRKFKGYPSVPTEDDDNEEVLYRRSVLKKYMDNNLFLDIESKSEGKLFEQLLVALAAGIAMFISTLIAFISKFKFGELSTPLFIIAIVAYMLKDRMKQFLRGYFRGKLQKFFYDHKLNIFSREDKKIGLCKESFNFVKDAKVPEQIKKLRNRDQMTEIESGWKSERVILYRKQIRIFRDKMKEVYQDYEIDSINDIIRINISKFLKNMDNPKKKLYVTESGRHRKISGERVYHLNMVIKFILGEKVVFKRYRIIFNRDGIKRIEKVATTDEEVGASPAS